MSGPRAALLFARRRGLATMSPLGAVACAVGLLVARGAFAGDGACRALADSRGLSAALVGTLYADAQSFDRTQASVAAVDQDIGADPLYRRLVAGMVRKASILQAQREVVRQAHESLVAISRASGDLLEASETLSSLMLQSGASPAHIAAVLQLAMLSQRLGRSADTFIGFVGVDPESVFLLGKDLNTYDLILSGLLNGNAELRLRAQHDPAIVRQLAKVQGVLAGIHASANGILANLQGLVAARESQAALQQDADQLGHTLAMACADSDAGVKEPLRLPRQVAPAASAAKTR
jgi:hypothetical protein